MFVFVKKVMIEYIHLCNWVYKSKAYVRNLNENIWHQFYADWRSRWGQFSVIIKFTLSNQVATLSQFAVQLVTKEEYKKCSKDLGKNTSRILMPVFRLSIST